MEGQGEIETGRNWIEIQVEIQTTYSWEYMELYGIYKEGGA